MTPKERAAAFANGMFSGHSDLYRDDLATAFAETRRQALEEATLIARDGCLVPPDGGSPNGAEVAMCDWIAGHILALIDQPPEPPKCWCEAYIRPGYPHVPDCPNAAAPIDIVLFCPSCFTQHIDAPEPNGDWTNPPHKSHLCHHCKTVWRPASVETNGVAHVPPGSRDTVGCMPVPAAPDPMALALAKFWHAITHYEGTVAELAWFACRISTSGGLTDNMGRATPLGQRAIELAEKHDG